MAPVNSQPNFKPVLINVAGRGLGWRNEDGIFKPVSKVGIKCVAPIALQSKSLKGDGTAKRPCFFI